MGLLYVERENFKPRHYRTLAYLLECAAIEAAVAGWHTAALANPITIVEWMKGFEMVLSERQETGICTRVNRAF